MTFALNDIVHFDLWRDKTACKNATKMLHFVDFNMVVYQRIKLFFSLKGSTSNFVLAIVMNYLNQ